MAVALSVFDEMASGDPYPTYERLRSHPVQRAEADGVWVVSRHADVIEVLRQPTSFSSEVGINRLMAGELGPSSYRDRDETVMAGSMRDLRFLIASDPPTHTWLRRAVSRAFTPSSVAALEGRIRQVSDELVRSMLARQAAGEAVDLVEDLAWPLPVTMIAELLGIPVERRADFKRWSDALVGGLDGSLRFDEIAEPAAELFGYLGELVELRRAAPTDDLLGRLVGLAPEPGEEPLGPMEITMFCVLLLIGGNETTTNLLGNAAAAFAAFPDQAELLRVRPELVGPAVEETLRYDAPVQGLFRTTLTPTRVGDVELPADADVMVLFASANRDPARFGSPEQFRIERNPRDHLAFGWGIHLCLGAALARLEARVAIETLVELTTAVEPAGAPRRNPGYLLRGFQRFPVTLHPRA